jgi:hypothetical protein
MPGNLEPKAWAALRRSDDDQQHLGEVKMTIVDLGVARENRAKALEQTVTGSETIELFHVRSIAPELKGHRDVPISWFVSERPQPLGLSYASLIENYDPADRFRMYSEGAIDELFTRAEADALVAYLKDHYDDLRPATHSRQNQQPFCKVQVLGRRALAGAPRYLSPVLARRKLSASK